MINYETWCSLMQILIKIFCLHLISIKNNWSKSGHVNTTEDATWKCGRWSKLHAPSAPAWVHVMIFNGHQLQCVNFWCMITREFYINILEESTHIIDSLGRNLSLNLTHHFVGQIWSFSTPFAFHIVLPVKHQLLIPSCLGLTSLKYVLHHIQRVHRREDDSGRNA